MYSSYLTNLYSNNFFKEFKEILTKIIYKVKSTVI